jgi:hypothetical protein
MYRRLFFDINVVFRMHLFCIEQTVKYKDTVRTLLSKAILSKIILKFIFRDFTNFYTHLSLCNKL